MGVFNVSSVNEDFDFTPSELDYVDADRIMMGENFAQMAIMDAADYIQEHSDLIRAMGGQEISITENGEEVIYEASTLEGIGEKIKALVKKFIAKIKELISKLVAVFSSWTQNDKDFINKYSKTFTTNWVKVKKLKVKAYKYHQNIRSFDLKVTIPNNLTGIFSDAEKHEKINSDYTNSPEKVIASINKVDNTDLSDYLRAVVFNAVAGKNANSSMTSKEFSEELHELWRAGDSAKEEMDKSDLESNGYSAANIIATLQNGEKATSEAKKAFEKAERTLNKWVKEHIDKPLKDATKFENGSSEEKNKKKTAKAAYLTFQSSCATTSLEAMHTGLGIFAQLCKEYSRTCKTIATKVVAMGEKRLAQEESYDFGNDNDDENYNESYMNAVVIK